MTPEELGDENEPENPGTPDTPDEPNDPDNPDTPTGNGKILVAYFSAQGHT